MNMQILRNSMSLFFWNANKIMLWITSCLKFISLNSIIFIVTKQNLNIVYFDSNIFLAVREYFLKWMLIVIEKAYQYTFIGLIINYNVW